MANMVNLSDEAVKVVETYAKQMDVEKNEAASRLIGIARSRVSALRKYAHKKAQEKAEGNGKPPKKAKPNGKAKAAKGGASKKVKAAKVEKVETPAVEAAQA